jgi:hypothetical protein
MFSNLSVPVGQAAALTKTVAYSRLVKTTNYSAWSRASDAALWLDGGLRIVPTIGLAAEVFNTNYRRIKQAQAELARQRERNKRHANGHTSVNGNTSNLSDGAVDGIVAAVGPDRIMAALDRATRPRLQAAE